MELLLTEQDLKSFQVAPGMGISASDAKKIVSLMTFFGMEIKDIVAQSPTVGGGKTVFCRVVDLVAAGVPSNAPMNLYICAQNSTIQDDGTGFVEPHGHMVGLTLQRIFRQAAKLNSAFEPVLELANQYVANLPEIPGVQRPTALQLVCNSEAILPGLNVTSRIAIQVAGL